MRVTVGRTHMGVQAAAHICLEGKHARINVFQAHIQSSQSERCNRYTAWVPSVTREYWKFACWKDVHIIYTRWTTSESHKYLTCTSVKLNAESLSCIVFFTQVVMRCYWEKCVPDESRAWDYGAVVTLTNLTRAKISFIWNVWRFQGVLLFERDATLGDTKSSLWY